MSTQIGTASDYVDLLVKLDAFLCTTGHAWGKRFTGVGTGDLIDYLGTASSVAETFTLTATNATTFTVVGSVSGALANATVGTPYSSAKIAFTITAGGTAYQAGDAWTINTTPPWSRLRRGGCPDTRYWTTNLSNPRNLIDSSSSSFASAAATSTHVEWECLVATRVRRVYARASGTPARMPTSFVLRWKDNPGDAWTTAETFTKASWTSGEAAIFITAADPGEHRYWRIEMSGATTSTEIESLLLYRDTTSLQAPVVMNARAEWAWSAPGLDGTKAVVCTAATAHDQPADTWNVGLGMARTWSENEELTLQPGTQGGLRGLPLGTSPIAYWLVVNGQRAIVLARFSGTYQLGYIGFGNAYEPPSAHAYPAVCAASYIDATLRYSSTSMEYRFPIDPAPGTCWAYYPDAAWRQHSNRSTSGGGGTEGQYDGAAGRGKVWPASFNQTTAPLNFVRDNIDGGRPLVPCVLLSDRPHVFGELDGLFWTTGFGTAAEAIIRDERFDHLVVPNVFRTGTKDYGAVRLD